MKCFSPERLASRRRTMGKTQRSLSLDARISQMSVWAMENGRKEPRASTLARLAECLECETDYFFVNTNNSYQRGGRNGNRR